MLRLCFVAVMICCCHVGETSHSACTTTDTSVVKFFDVNKSWQEARKFCQSTEVMGSPGDLAIDTSSEMHTFIDETVNKLAWIGASDLAEENKWMWVNDKPVDRTDERWSSGEPNDKNGQDCMVANYLGHHWDDQGCTYKQPFVCEYKTSAFLHSVFVVSGNRLVQRFTQRKTFANAQGACKTAGGSMVAPDSDVINWLKTQYGETWTGATDEATEGEWIMSNGKTLNTTSELWAPGSPNNFGRSEHCALYTIGGLNDKYCMELHPYACEFNACENAESLTS